jgi:hypothetical protein
LSHKNGNVLLENLRHLTLQLIGCFLVAFFVEEVVAVSPWTEQEDRSKVVGSSLQGDCTTTTIHRISAAAVPAAAAAAAAGKPRASQHDNASGRRIIRRSSNATPPNVHPTTTYNTNERRRPSPHSHDGDDSVAVRQCSLVAARVILELATADQKL